MTAAQLTVNGKRPPVLGTFSKAIDGARALSFGQSGGKHCPTSCRYHPESTAAGAIGGCYAVRTEAYRSATLRPKLVRHESADPDDLIAAAMDDLDKRHAFRLPWFRFSPFGQVPQQPPRLFRKLCQRLAAAGTPIHLPIAGPWIVKRYRRALAGLNVAVRESVHSARRWRIAPGAVSIVAGEGLPMLERIPAAKRAARVRTAATGRRCIVCPAVADSPRFGGRGAGLAKCGRCTACADPDTDIVYPHH